MTDHIPDATKMVSDHLASTGKPMPEPFGYFRPEPFGWTDCAETDEGAQPLFDVQAVHGLAIELASLQAAIRKLHAAKGRYHTQLACCDLFDLVGLPNERPKK